MKYLFCPMLIISLFVFISGCGEDPEPQPQPKGPPRVVSTSPEEGEAHPAHAMVIFTLNQEMSSVAISGAPGDTVIKGKNVCFTPLGQLPDGTITLIITGTDMQNRELEPFTLTFTAVRIGEPPSIDGFNCDPKEGASDVDPSKYLDGFRVAFSDRLSRAQITSTKPEFDYALTIDASRMQLMVKFLDYTIPYETSFEIKITATDVAGNSRDVTYSFTTMAKAER